MSQDLTADGPMAFKHYMLMTALAQRQQLWLCRGTVHGCAVTDGYLGTDEALNPSLDAQMVKTIQSCALTTGDASCLRNDQVATAESTRC